MEINQAHPLFPSAGIWKDDPTFEAYLIAVDAYRRSRDQEPEIGETKADVKRRLLRRSE